MVNDLAKQLDLVVYDASGVAWWCKPYLWVIVGIVLVLTVAGYWWYRRYVRARAVTALPAQIFDLLSGGIAQFERGALSGPDMAALVMNCLKAYTAWRCSHDGIHAFTDVQWLEYVQQEALFGDVLGYCSRAVQIAGITKFNGAVLVDAQAHDLVGLVMRIVNKTLPENG